MSSIHRLEMGDVGELPTLTSPYEFRQSTFLSIVLTGYALIWAVTTILIFFPIPLVRVLKPVINRFQSNDPSICHYHCSSGEEDHVEKTTQPRKMGKKWNVNWPDLDDKTAKPNDLDDWEKTAKKSPFWCKAEAIFEKIKLVFTGEPKRDIEMEYDEGWENGVVAPGQPITMTPRMLKLAKTTDLPVSKGDENQEDKEEDVGQPVIFGVKRVASSDTESSSVSEMPASSSNTASTSTSRYAKSRSPDAKSSKCRSPSGTSRRASTRSPGTKKFSPRPSVSPRLSKLKSKELSSISSSSSVSNVPSESGSENQPFDSKSITPSDSISSAGTKSTMTSLDGSTPSASDATSSEGSTVGGSYTSTSEVSASRRSRFGSSSGSTTSCDSSGVFIDASKSYQRSSSPSEDYTTSGSYSKSTISEASSKDSVASSVVSSRISQPSESTNKTTDGGSYSSSASRLSSTSSEPYNDSEVPSSKASSTSSLGASSLSSATNFALSKPSSTASSKSSSRKPVPYSSTLSSPSSSSSLAQSSASSRRSVLSGSLAPSATSTCRSTSTSSDTDSSSDQSSGVKSVVSLESSSMSPSSADEPKMSSPKKYKKETEKSKAFKKVQSKTTVMSSDGKIPLAVIKTKSKMYLETMKTRKTYIIDGKKESEKNESRRKPKSDDDSTESSDGSTTLAPHTVVHPILKEGTSSESSRDSTRTLRSDIGAPVYPSISGSESSTSGSSTVNSSNALDSGSMPYIDASNAEFQDGCNTLPGEPSNEEPMTYGVYRRTHMKEFYHQRDPSLIPAKETPLSTEKAYIQQSKTGVRGRGTQHPTEKKPNSSLSLDSSSKTAVCQSGVFDLRNGAKSVDQSSSVETANSPTTSIKESGTTIRISSDEILHRKMYLPAETNVPKTIGKSQSIELKTDPISASIPTQKESPNLIANEPVRDEHVINMEFTHPKTLIRMQPVPEILFRAIRSVTDPIKTIKNSIVMKPIQPVLMKPIRMVHDEPKTSMLKKKKYQVDEQSKHLKGKLHQKKSVRSRSEPMLRKTDYLDYLPVGALPIKHTLNPELERLFDQAFKRKL